MEFFLFLFCFIYTVIGFGLFRLVNHVPSAFAIDCRNNFMTIVAWPVIMIMFAWNSDFHKDGNIAVPEDLSGYTL
jgi:hypothetical protein